MPTLKYLGETFDCTTAIKGDNYIHLLDDNGVMVAAFDAITDFSGFTLENGSYVAPTADHSCRVAVIRDDGTIGVGGHTCEDIGNAVPKTRKVNGKPLSADIAITGEDIDGIYSKDAVLKDQTKALYGLGADAVPDDVFRCLGESARPKVGDTLATFRTDLGDNWALCNGDTFSADEYPELAEVVPSPIGYTSLAKAYSCDGTNVKDCVHGGGHDVFLFDQFSGNYVYAGIVYSTDGFKTKNRYNIRYNGSLLSQYHSYTVVRYIDGMYIVGGAGSSSDSPGQMFLYYTTDITSGDWSRVNANVGVSKVYDIWKENGIYYIAAEGSGNANQHGNATSVLVKTPSITNPTWTSTALSVGANIVPYSFSRANGQYAFFGSRSGKLCTVHTNDLNGSWTITEATTDKTLNNYHPYGVIYDEENEIWAYITDRVIDNSTSFINVVYTTNLGSDQWKVVETTPNFISSNDFTPYKLVSVNGEFLATAFNGVYMYRFPSLLDPTGWQFIQIPSSIVNGNSGFRSPYNSDIVAPYIRNNMEIIFPGRYNSDRSVKLCLVLPLYMLPAIDSTPLYTYMKVKEDET